MIIKTHEIKFDENKFSIKSDKDIKNDKEKIGFFREIYKFLKTIHDDNYINQTFEINGDQIRKQSDGKWFAMEKGEDELDDFGNIESKHIWRGALYCDVE